MFFAVGKVLSTTQEAYFRAVLAARDCELFG